MYQAGPYSPNHATAGTFAFRAELLKETRYEDHAALAEEKFFLKNYTVPFVQLDPLKTILVFSHEHNTFDKRKLLDQEHNQYFKESPKTVNMFIRKPEEERIQQFFLKDIDELLAKYTPGEPSMKPDVMVQVKKIEEERQKLKAQNQQIVIHREGEPPKTLTAEEAMQLMNTQNDTIRYLTARVVELEKTIEQMKLSVLPVPPPVLPPVPLEESS
jgi:hypothetical protein